MRVSGATCSPRSPRAKQGLKIFNLYVHSFVDNPNAYEAGLKKALPQFQLRKALKLVIEKVKSQDDATGAALAEALGEGDLFKFRPPSRL